MVRIELEYEGDLRTRATHGPSGASMPTDAPVDNHGKGEAFSPTDLLATSLGACMITVMGIAAKKEDAVLDGARVSVQKLMTSSPPRRVAKLIVDVTIPEPCARMIDEATRGRLEHAAETCPVRLSLSPDVAVETRYLWEGA